MAVLEPTQTEQQVMLTRRIREAKDAGMTAMEARMFAESAVDIGELRKLLKLGCPPEYLARILR